MSDAETGYRSNFLIQTTGISTSESTFHYHDMTMPGTEVRSDFWQGMFSEFGMPERDMIGPFHGRHISIIVRATKGLIRFHDSEGGRFTFYKKGENGQIDLDTPLKQINALMR